MAAVRGRIAVLIEDHFDQTEFRLFNAYFPERGFDVEYVSHLWGNPEITFGSNPDEGYVGEHVTVRTEIAAVRPSDYDGIVLIGAYAMDRLRYQEKVHAGAENLAPAVVFVRQAMREQIPVGAIFHSLWLLCADRSLLADRRVTCAHNIVCDVENAGATVVYEDDGTADIVVDGNLITGKHPDVTAAFMTRFADEIERIGPRAVAG